MNAIFEWLSRLFGSWKFWVVIPPWDIGVRIRLGKIAAELKPGAHLRIPLLDDIVLVNTRTRLVTTPCVTAKAENGKTRVSSAAVSFRIAKPVIAMLSFENPEHAVMLLVQSKLCRTPDANDVLTQVKNELAQKGIDVQFVEYVEHVEVRTYRLLSDTWKLGGNYGAMPGIVAQGVTRW